MDAPISEFQLPSVDRKTDDMYNREEMMRFWQAALAAAALCATTTAAAVAQDYPTRPVRIVVPAAPGGSFDALARMLAQGLSERWPQRVIVDNRPGGGGNIGAVAVTKADPDGYTLLVWNDTLLINPHLYKEAPFDPKRDFTPISLSMYSPNVLAAHPSANLKTFQDFLQAARANPGKLSYGSPGNGSPGHLSAELLKRLANIDIVHVPYRGAGPAIIDMVAGQIPMGMVAIPGAVGHVKSGALVALAVTSRERVKALPSVPTIAEAGVPDYRINAFHGILGPAGMPAAVVAKLEKDVNEVLKSPEVTKKLIDLGFEPVAGSAADFAAIIDRDLPVWQDVVQKSGARAE
jgi:tripartite-type tricarboxylate transporter receptor subunit TctC